MARVWPSFLIVFGLLALTWRLMDAVKLVENVKKGPKPPCQLAFMKEDKETTKDPNGIPVQINGKKFVYREKSVVVVCKNMNATDVERLVPRLALPGCNPKHPRARRRQSRHQYTGRCIEVNQNQTASSSDLDSTSSNCRGETDLCQSLENNSNGCSNQDDKNDVLCRLMHKVRHYLRTRYNVTEEEVDEDDKDGGASSPPAAVNSSLLRPRRKQLLRPNPTRAMPKIDRGSSHVVASSEVKTLAVLLPCRERNSKVTKMWLRRLQQYLYYHYKNKAAMAASESGQHENVSPHSKRPRFKILTLFSCKARERLALMERPDLAGILSFEPRPSTQPPSPTQSQWSNLKKQNVTEVSYCDQRTLTTLQLARLGQRLSRSGNLNVVYTYSKASTPAMKLLANLILHQHVTVTGINSVPPNQEDVAEAVEDAWASTHSDTVLYIGGPPRPDQTCAISELSQMAQIMGSSLASSQVDLGSLNLETDCDCRQWAFQFLRRPLDIPPVTLKEASTTSSTSTTTSSSSSPPSSSSATTTDATTATTSETQSSTSTTSTGSTPPESTSSTDWFSPTPPRPKKKRPTAARPPRRPSNLPSNTQDPGRVLPIQTSRKERCRDLLLGVPVYETSEEADENSSNSLWRSLGIVISAIGLSVVVIAFLADIVSLYRAEKALGRHAHEVFLPLGLVLLYASIAVMAPKGFYLTPSLCALRRTLPGMGLVAAFVGLILQLVHELDKNVYIVNPERVKAWMCGLSKRSGLLLLGLLLVGIQVVLLASWIGARPPRVDCDIDGSLECAALMKIEDYYPLVYTYPVILGLIICGLSGISLKWKTNSGATWNLLALTVTFITWAITATVETLSTNHGSVSPADDGKDYRWAPESVLPRNSLNLVSHTVTAVMLLACVFLRRTIARMRGLNVDNRELELTSNCTIPEISRGRRHASSSESNFSTSPASSTLPLPDFHQPHSHVNRSYTNTYSSCSSFKLPNIIAMPESSAWPDIQRWGRYNDENDDLSEEHVVVHNELYISENDENPELLDVDDLEDDVDHPDHIREDNTMEFHAEYEEAYESSDERQSHLSGISQQDRDNKTILLRQAASGISRI